MLRSKATAALLRLKEMDKKYNIKRNEGKQAAQTDNSTDSSLEDYPKLRQDRSTVCSGRNASRDGQISSHFAEQRELTPKVSPKSKMEVRIPTTYPRSNDTSVTDSAPSKRSRKVSSKTRSSIDSDRSVKFEADVDPPSKSHSSSRISSNGRASARVVVKATATHESFGSPRSIAESSVPTVFSRRSEISEVIDEAAKSINEYSSSRRSGDRSQAGRKFGGLVAVPRDNGPAPVSDSGGTTIEEVIKLTEDKSEILSELSLVMDRNVSLENVSSREEKIRYEDDTFEEASSSSGSSLEKPTKALEGSTIVSGVKQIKITPHKQTETVQQIEFDEDSNKEIVELVPPKILQSTSECDIGLDEELSNYVKTTENIDEALPISLLKLSKHTPRKHVKRNKKHRKQSTENSVEKTDSSVASEHEKLTERRENQTKDDAPNENTSTTSAKCGKKDPPLRDVGSKEECAGGVETEMGMRMAGNVKPQPILSEEKLLTETPKKSDVTSTLRKLNKDAIDAIIRRHRIHTSRDVPSKSRHRRNHGNAVKLPLGDATRNVDDDNSCVSSCENIKDPYRSRDKKVKTRRCSRSSKSKKGSNHNKIEGKHSRFECRQTYRLRKYAAMLRFQQEREDVRNYLAELERTRLEFGPGASVASSHLNAFKPLDFPKIAAFFKPETDMDQSSLRNKDEVARLQERLLIIRQWLKDQYILYRDYSNLAKTTNSKYIPANLEDAKRTIRQLQKATIKSR